MEETKISFENLPDMVFSLISKIDSLESKLQQTVFCNNKKEQNTKQWFNIEELRDYLPEHPSKATIYSWVSKRLIPHHKGSKSLRFSQSEIDKWLESGKRKSDLEIAEEAIKYLSKHRGGLRYE